MMNESIILIEDSISESHKLFTERFAIKHQKLNDVEKNVHLVEQLFKVQLKIGRLILKKHLKYKVINSIFLLLLDNRKMSAAKNSFIELQGDQKNCTKAKVTKF
jgi:hypothetical protein